MRSYTLRTALNIYVIVLIFMAAFLLGLHMDPLIAWFLGITFVTFGTYGYDKLIAGSKRMRIPEKVLLALAFTGGTLGAIAGMEIFRHKTAKGSFQLKFWLVALLQVVLIVVYFIWIRPLF